MMNQPKLFTGTLLFVATLFASLSAHGQDIHVSIKNEGNSDFFLTPLWFGLHDGTFDLFNPGETASVSLEALAEGGDVSGLEADFGSSFQGVAANSAGFGGAPVIDPGETAMASITPMNPVNYRYFSYASMIIPSNDVFIGNGNPLAYEVFDAAGNFNGPVTIQIFGNNIWDAGTEVNDTMGAAFSGVGGTASDEGGTVALLASGGLDNFLNTGIAPGGTIGNLIAADDLLATITISQAAVPEPSAGLMLGLGGILLGLVRRRR